MRLWDSSVWLLVAGVVVATAAGPAIGQQPVIDLPPIDVNRGDWWVFVLLYLVDRLYLSRRGPITTQGK